MLYKLRRLNFHIRNTCNSCIRRCTICSRSHCGNVCTVPRSTRFHYSIDPYYNIHIFSDSHPESLFPLEILLHLFLLLVLLLLWRGDKFTGRNRIILPTYYYCYRSRHHHNHHHNHIGGNINNSKCRVLFALHIWSAQISSTLESLQVLF